MKAPASVILIMTSKTSITVQSANGMRRHIRAAILVALLMIAIRIAVAFDAGDLMLVPLFASMIVVTRFSPPVAALSLLYGWVLFGLMDFRGFGFIPRIPTISTVTVWIVLWLFYWRRVDGTLKRLNNSVVINHLFVLLLFLAVGFLGALNSGYLSNPIVRFHNWDICRAWAGYFVIAMLGCRDLDDLKVILIGLPFAFLIYPLSLPLETWQNFFRYSFFSYSPLNIGLYYGSLNTNTLGQAAAVSSVVALAAAWNVRRLGLRNLMFFLFALSGAIVFFTAARQALLGWLAGLCAIGILSGFGRALLWLVLLSFLIYVGAQIAINILPVGSGFQTRLLELTQPPETWASRSFTTRRNDFEEALERWTEAPLLGVGFGGQRFDEIPSIEITELVSGGESTYALYALHGTHNLFLGILAQTGVVGLILFLSFWLSILKQFFSATHSVQHIYGSNIALARVAVLSAFVCIFVVQNISGGMGAGSSSLIFLLGALLGISGAAQTAAMPGCRS